MILCWNSNKKHLNEPVRHIDLNFELFGLTTSSLDR